MQDISETHGLVTCLLDRNPFLSWGINISGPHTQGRHLVSHNLTTNVLGKQWHGCLCGRKSGCRSSWLRPYQCPNMRQPQATPSPTAGVRHVVSPESAKSPAHKERAVLSWLQTQLLEASSRPKRRCLGTKRSIMQIAGLPLGSGI